MDTPDPHSHQTTKMVSILFGLIIITLIIFLFSYIYYQDQDSADDLNNATTETSTGSDSWQTCRNEAYGYQINYPSDWHVMTPAQGEARVSTCLEGSPNTLFSPERSIARDGDRISIDILDEQRLNDTIYNGVDSPEEYFQRNPDLLDHWDIEDQIMLDGEEAFLLRHPEQNIIWLITIHDNKIYEIRTTGDVVDEGIWDQALSSFSFLPGTTD